MKKVLLLLVFPFIFATKTHGAQEPDLRYGSLGLVLNEAQKRKATWLHFFDIADEDDGADKKPLLSRLWRQERKISTQDMQDISKEALFSMREAQSPDGINDHVVLDAVTWELNEKSWLENKLPLRDIFSKDGTAVPTKHRVIIYAVADDTRQTPKWHADRINSLKNSGGSLVINVSKGMWEKMYGLVAADKTVAVWGDKPSRNYMMLLIAGGGVAVSALIVYLCHKYLH